MMRALVLLAFLLFVSCSFEGDGGSPSAVPEKDDKVKRLEKARDAVVPFFQPMKVLDGDWLKSQRETGETFEEYIASNPTLPTEKRRTIYIQPIGNFTPEQETAIGLAADYMQAF